MVGNAGENEQPEEFEDVDLDDTVVPTDDQDEEKFPENRFNISSYGWDSDVEGLVKRLKRGDIHVPSFQRGFVWRNPQKSRFIESLIMGLPVPNIFLARDSKTSSLNIVDGQQRLLSLRDYLDGKFYLSGDNIAADLKGCYYSPDVARSKSSKTLTPRDARTLADSVIHSIVIKPDPSDDDKNLGHEYNQAVIQIFRRLNTSSQPLVAQEIRTSIFYGTLDDLVRDLNKNEDWRLLFGKPHSRLRDMELILRSLAVIDGAPNYRAPMPRFLDSYMEKNRQIDEERAKDLRDVFTRVTKAIVQALGKDGLRNGSTFMITKLDAAMAGFSAYYRKYADLDPNVLKARFDELEQDGDPTDEEGYEKSYLWSTAEFVNDTDRLAVRIKRAREIIGA